MSWTPSESRRCSAPAIYVDEAARALRLCLLLAEQTERAEHLQSAMASRSTIDQALGVIMGQNRISRDEAFAILRSASQHRNVKLREVAAMLIENLTGHQAAEPPPFGSSPAGSAAVPRRRRPRTAPHPWSRAPFRLQRDRFRAGRRG